MLSHTCKGGFYNYYNKPISFMTMIGIIFILMFAQTEICLLRLQRNHLTSPAEDSDDSAGCRLPQPEHTRKMVESAQQLYTLGLQERHSPNKTIR